MDYQTDPWNGLSVDKTNLIFVYNSIDPVRSKTQSSRKTRRHQRISFPRFSTLSFPFCTIPKTENSEMKTSECSFKPFYKLRAFPTLSVPFCTIPKTENSEMKTSKCSFKPFYQTPSFPFCTIPKTENSEMKTSKCSFKPFYQTPSFPFCTIPKTENSELETSEFSLRFTRTAVFF